MGSKGWHEPHKNAHELNHEHFIFVVCNLLNKLNLPNLLNLNYGKIPNSL